MLGNLAERGLSNALYGTHHNLVEGLAMSFLTGAAVGALAGYFKSAPKAGDAASMNNKLPGINKFGGSFKLRSFTGIRQVLEPKPHNPWLHLTSAKAIVGGKEMLKQGGRLGAWGAKEVFRSKMEL